MRLPGKVGIVTGGSLGIGRAGALRFAREGAGVAVVARDAAAVQDTVRSIESAGGQALGLSGDLADEAFARSIVHATARHFGGLDFVWNNVGHPGPAAFEDLDLLQYDHAMNINLRTTLATTAEALPYLRLRGGGSVLFTSSISGLMGSPFSPVYSAAKFAVVGMARSLAKRHGKDNIRFNVLCPGTTDTAMLRVFIARPDQKETQGLDPEELIKARAGSNALGRHGQPEDVAHAALFLLSDEAAFITGVSLPVDGGVLA